ncbi:hypothetical protein [Aureivirga marina]|uniref:hypothetical protein n=1 Tax=Aureivirga marina TaxID=1182451 RepID=UPI0018CA9B89|nr:hypothetical protein [Aureivirga marina]
MNQKEIISDISKRLSEHLLEENKIYEKEASFLNLLIGLSSGSFILIFSLIFKNNTEKVISNLNLITIVICFILMLIFLIWHQRAIKKISLAYFHRRFLFDLQENILIQREVELKTASDIIKFKDAFFNYKYIENEKNKTDILFQISLYPYLIHRKISYFSVIILFIIQYISIAKIILTIIN